MQNDDFKNENQTDANNMLPAGVSKFDLNAKWECCKCGWIGKHSESADKTLVINGMYLLVCPKCGNKDEFFQVTVRVLAMWRIFSTQPIRKTKVE